jgi:hypothetical protein
MCCRHPKNGQFDFCGINCHQCFLTAVLKCNDMHQFFSTLILMSQNGQPCYFGLLCKAQAFILGKFVVKKQKEAHEIGTGSKFDR